MTVFQPNLQRQSHSVFVECRLTETGGVDLVGGEAPTEELLVGEAVEVAVGRDAVAAVSVATETQVPGLQSRVVVPLERKTDRKSLTRFINDR